MGEEQHWEEASWLIQLGVLFITILTLAFLRLYGFGATVWDWLKERRSKR